MTDLLAQERHPHIRVHEDALVVQGAGQAAQQPRAQRRKPLRAVHAHAQPRPRPLRGHPARQEQVPRGGAAEAPESPPLYAPEALPDPALPFPRRPDSLLHVGAVPRAEGWPRRSHIPARPQGQRDLDEAFGPGASVPGVIQRSPFLVEVAIWGRRGGPGVKGEKRDSGALIRVVDKAGVHVQLRGEAQDCMEV